MELWTAFLLGLLGSIHCVGMCGPIALSLPLTVGDKAKILFQLSLYHAGRIISYGLIGVIVGLLGRFIFFSGYQQMISISIGALIILGTLLYLIRKKIVLDNPILNKINALLSKGFQKWMNRPSMASFGIVGLLNGFLPCGLVYVAAIGAYTSDSIWSSALYMSAFGLGTIPLLMFTIIIGKKVLTKFNVSKIVPYMVMVLATLLIMRGLNLNIPYVSPQIQKTITTSDSLNCD